MQMRWSENGMAEIHERGRGGFDYYLIEVIFEIIKSS